jgi:chorismate dehydratase
MDAMDVISQRVVVGAVAYVNSKPLVFGLDERLQQGELRFDVPSRLADQLADGRIDVGLIPSVEYLRHPDYRMVSDACIGCRGPVLSVRMYSRVAPDRIRTLDLDEGSRTSAVMLQILLAHQYGVQPQLQLLPIGHGLSDSGADAVLLIGDRAIEADAEGFPFVCDVGDAWCKYFGLPFVFAVWAARDGSLPEGVDLVLSAARDDGLRHLEQIAETEAPGLGMTRAACHSYLRDNLYFRFGPDQQRGLDLFAELAADMNLLTPVAFHARMVTTAGCTRTR